MLLLKSYPQYLGVFLTRFIYFVGRVITYILIRNYIIPFQFFGWYNLNPGIIAFFNVFVFLNLVIIRSFSPCNLFYNRHRLIFGRVILLILVMVNIYNLVFVVLLVYYYLLLKAAYSHPIRKFWNI